MINGGLDICRKLVGYIFQGSYKKREEGRRKFCFKRENQLKGCREIVNFSFINYYFILVKCIKCV